VQQVTKVELVINLKTVKTLGITVPVTRRIYGANVSAIITQRAEGYDNGIRAYHFTLGAITWIASPYLFLIATTGVLALLFWRQTKARKPTDRRQDYCLPRDRWGASSLRTPRRLNFVAAAQILTFRREGSFCSATVLLECMTPTAHVCGRTVADVLFSE
jgi:hypothetical protein